MVEQPPESDLQPMLVRLHLGTIATLTVLFVVLVALDPPGGDANIGLGIVLMPIMFFGLPWSVAVWALSGVVGFSGTPVLSTLWLCSIMLTAIVNVWLHVHLYRRFRRRRGLPAPL